MEWIEALEYCFDMPPEDAAQWLKMNGFELTQGWQEQLEVIQRHSFTVAMVTSADKLQKIHNELVSAMEKGTPFREWVKAVKDVVPQKTNWKTVYRTNMASAYNSGRYVSQVAAAEYVPIWVHNCVMDRRTRDLGKVLNGKAYRFDDPHWNSYYPPNEFNDRDSIMAMTEKSAERNGYQIQTEAPKLKGEVVKPHDAFNNNPAKTVWEPDLTKYTPEIKREVEIYMKNMSGKTVPTEPILVSTFGDE